MRQRLADWILSLYPKSWRDRYEPEVRELLRQSSPRWRDVGDLLWAAGDEWAARLAQPSVWAWLALAYTALVVMWIAAEFAAGLIALAVRGYSTSALWTNALASLLMVTPKMAVLYFCPGFLVTAVVYLAVINSRWGAAIQSRVPTLFAPGVFTLGGVCELFVVHGPYPFDFLPTVVLPWAMAWAVAGMVMARFAASDRQTTQGIAAR